MGQEIVYCSVCGDRITGADFEKLRAVTVLKKHYCRKCSKEVIKDSSEGAAHDPTATPPRVRTRTARVPRANAPQVPGSNKFLWIIAGVLLAALIAAAYALLAQRG